MSNSITGVVHLVEETKEYGAKGFRKRLFVLEQNDGRFANYIPIEFIQDNCDSVNGLELGTEIKVRFRLGGRKWQKDPSSETRYFLSAEALGFDVVGTAPAPNPSVPPSDDIPF